VREHADPHLTCILVGNKADLVSDPAGEGGTGSGHGRHREVTTEEAEIWAKEEGLLFVEASAKSGQNVQLAFEQASRDILDKIKRGVFEDDRVKFHPRNFTWLADKTDIVPCAVAWREAFEAFHQPTGLRADGN
jgi:GTPase SAR1 family protein